MARPKKTGLDYFPLNVDFFSDEKVGAISGEFGIKGEIITVKLLCAIYRNGYFILWDEALEMSLLKALPGISLELLERVVFRLVKWGFFEQDLFGTAKVLTSRGIQRRYFEAVKRRDRKDAEYPYLLVNVDNNQVNVYRNSVNVDSNPQRKDNNRLLSSSFKENRDISLTDVHDISSSDKSDVPEKAHCGNGFDFDGFLDFFNSTVSGGQIPKIRILTDRRKSSVRARMDEYGQDALFEAVRKAAASSFLNGGGDKAWIADFDWIFRPNNFPKVLEGNYDNKTGVSKNHGNQYQTAYGQQRQDAEQRRQDAEDIMRKFIAENNK